MSRYVTIVVECCFDCIYFDIDYERDEICMKYDKEIDNPDIIAPFCKLPTSGEKNVE